MGDPKTMTLLELEQYWSATACDPSMCGDKERFEKIVQATDTGLGFEEPQPRPSSEDCRAIALSPGVMILMAVCREDKSDFRTQALDLAKKLNEARTGSTDHLARASEAAGDVRGLARLIVEGRVSDEYVDHLQQLLRAATAGR